MAYSSAFRCLRFPYYPMGDESVCGALASACHEQRLRSMASALEGGGVHLPRPGSIQFAPPEILDAVSAIMQTDARKLRLLSFAPTGSRDKIALGDLIMPRKVFDWSRRRIGPMSLRQKPHHRSAWLNLLLPYCPESLELLVDECASCGPLGWRHTRGIANCDECGLKIPPANEASLSSKFAGEYRVFAALASRHEQLGQEAVRRFPDAVQAISRTGLVHFAWRSGLVFSPGKSRCRLGDLLQKDPAAIAHVLSTGVRLLTDWPSAIRQAADSRIAELKDDLVGFECFMRDVRWIGRDTTGGAAVLIDQAFPILDGRNAHAFAKEVRYYTATEVNTLLWSSSKDLKTLRECDAVRYEKLPARLRTRARYNADDVDTLRTAIETAISPAVAAVRLGLPTYAIDQLAAAGVLLTHNSPGIVILRGGAQVQTDSLSALLESFIASIKPGAAPSGYLPLSRALRAFPGEKPWAAAVEAIVAGGLPAHLHGSEPLVRHALVCPSAVLEIVTQPLSGKGSAMNLSHVSLSDATEVLGTTFDEGMAAIRAGFIKVVQMKKGKGVARNDLLRLASQVAFTSEAASLTGIHPGALARRFKRMGVRRLWGAWHRADLVDVGMVRPFAYVAHVEPG